MPRTYKRDSRGRFAGGGGSGSGRASRVTGNSGSGKKFKGEVGIRGKRLENASGNYKRLPESGSSWGKRSVSRSVFNSTPSGTIAKSRAKRSQLGRAGSGATKAVPAGAKGNPLSFRGQAQAANRKRDPGGQAVRAAARARDNKDRATAGRALARKLSKTPKYAKVLHAHNAVAGKKAAQSSRTAKKALAYYKRKSA
jgi:hypothetical protein